MMKLDRSMFQGMNVAQKRQAWRDLVAKLPADAPAEEYNNMWYDLREEFYANGGYTSLQEPDVGRLKSLKDKYKGKRIFIIGNGPSLNRTPLEFLKDEYTFAVNRFHLMYDRISWRPTFYTICDRRVIKDIANEVNALTGSTCFLDEKFRGMHREGDDIYYTNVTLKYDKPEEQHFSYDISKGVRASNTVVGVAIQIAQYMGFGPIYMIGCDLGYKVLETVEQKGDDKFNMGVGFDLTSTKDDDPNHFDPRYFGKGRLWHAPNVKGMVEHHTYYRTAVERAGNKIYNATVGGELEAYERVNFDDLFPGMTYSRDDHAQVDETHAVAALYKDKPGAGKFMLDVGACGGGSAAHFLTMGWKTICFEPDPANRAQLSKRFAKNDHVIIDPRAVSDAPAKKVRFFSSKESKGISGLLAFRDTHEVADYVDITTLKAVVHERQVEHVDFLKIDVEGYDFSVLKGFPWDRLRPDVIESEFEDAKTLKLGHKWQDIADFLLKKGYAVYVSEWHPIIRYGIQHDWRRVVPYPGVEIPADAWGNLLAFREDPGLDAVMAAFRAVMKLNGVPADKSAQPSAKASAPAPAAVKKAPAPATAKPVPAAQPAAPAPAKPVPVEGAADNGVGARLSVLSQKFAALAASARKEAAGGGSGKAS